MKVVIVSGPTATGKTDLSIELARKFGGEIVNFDSLLLYKEINIGTAKPTLAERNEVPHHLIDVASIALPLNASDYAKLAVPLVEGLLKLGKLVYLVGGSGFYLQAILKGMYDSPTTPPEVREKSDRLYQAEGIKPFIEILKQEDPQTYKKYHANDHYRVRRAVEHFWANGTTLSSVREKKTSENVEISGHSIHQWDILHIHLDLPREEHIKIIENRAERMLSGGMIQEVDSLLEQGFNGSERPLQSIGYKEILEMKFGVLKDLKACQERMVISTRQLAKSQRTWFNKIEKKTIFHPLREKELAVALVGKFVKDA